MANAPVAGTEEEQTPQSTPDPSASAPAEEPNAESGEEKAPEPELTPDSHLESFIKEAGLSTEVAQGEEGTEPDSSPSPEVLAQAQQIAEAERQTERKQRETEGVKTAFSQRAQGIRSYLLARNVPPQDVEAVVNEFNNHHAQSSTVSKTEAVEETNKSYNEAMFQAIDKNIPSMKGKRDFGNLDVLMKAVTTEARKGFVSEKDHKADVAAKLLDYKKSLEEKGFIVSKAPTEDNDTTGADNQSSLDFALNGSIEQIIAARQKRLG